jgi:hypothetical protein
MRSKYVHLRSGVCLHSHRLALLSVIFAVRHYVAAFRRTYTFVADWGRFDAVLPNKVGIQAEFLASADRGRRTIQKLIDHGAWRNELDSRAFSIEKKL